MNHHVYHYHAVLQLTDGNVVNMDGIAGMNEKIMDFSAYSELKELILRNEGFSIVPTSCLTIENLSYLGTKD